MNSPHYAFFSLQGGRECNEDTVLVSVENRRLIAVIADGLGGQGSGDLASHLGAEAAMDCLRDAAVLNHAVIQSAFIRANAAVLAKQRELQNRMMSTLSVAILESRSLWIGHLGDTRIYRFRQSHLVSCSHDHSVTQLIADRGEITRDEMRHHETRNLLLHCLGNLESPDAVISHHIWWPSSALLLCTDGFWEHFSDHELAAAMISRDPETILNNLQKTALSRLSEDADNLSAILIR